MRRIDIIDVTDGGYKLMPYRRWDPPPQLRLASQPLPDKEPNIDMIDGIIIGLLTASALMILFFLLSK